MILSNAKLAGVEGSFVLAFCLLQYIEFLNALPVLVAVVFRGLLLHMKKHECIEGDDMIVYLHFTLMLISITVITFVNSNEIISNNESWIMTLAVDLGSLTSLVYVEC
jgi:hypothetical protein